MEAGRLMPGGGALVAALETCTGTQSTLIGKPNPTILKQLMAEAGVSPEETIMVGDQASTDIACGLAAGTRAMLVLTGVSQTAPPGVAIGPDVGALLEA
jgi:ribonucleotide monophosphatase NagD (HAD superfamily)